MTRSNRRSTLATWLAVLGGVAIALGVLGLWAQRTLGDADTFAALAGDILEDPRIRTELAVVIVEPALVNAPEEIREQRAFIVSTTASVLGDARFVPLFEDVLRRAHQRLVEGEGPVRLELERPLDLVVLEVEPISPELAAELDAIDAPSVVVVSAAQADRLRGFVAVERAVSVILLVAGTLLVLVAVIRGGARALVPFGATLAGACLVLFGLLLLGRSLLLSGIHPQSRAAAAEAAWDIVIADLRTALLVSAAAGALALVAGAVLGRRA
ncbi:MAG: hypothetical protein ACRDHU_11030 [Actinomycetota bacterium]